MVKIRLVRRGAKKHPTYVVVVADSRTPRDGKFIDQIGNYNPMCNPAVVNIDVESAKNWMSKGAQPTDSVRKLFSKVGVN